MSILLKSRRLLDHVVQALTQTLSAMKLSQSQACKWHVTHTLREYPPLPF